MKRLLIVSALTLAFVVMWGQTGTAQMGDWGTISGTVTIQDSDQPLEHANVKAYAVDGYNWPVGLALSDESGNYEMNVPFGEYVVVADKWQYLPEWWQEAEHREDATSVTVGEDNNPTGIDFTLADVSSQFGSISGMVTDLDTGDPIGDALITIGREGDYHFHRAAHSGDDGSYMIDDVPPGMYTVECFKENYLPAQYPDTVEVNADDITGIDFALEPLVFGSIAGMVTDADTGEPLAGARVTAHLPDDHHFFRMVFTGDDGTYLIDELVPGEYTVSFQKQGYQDGEYPDPVAVDGDDITGIDFAMSPLVFGGISGTVTDAGTGEPIQWALVTAIGGDHPHHYRWAVTDENGEYEMQLLSGTYHVEARARGYFTGVMEDSIVVNDEVITGVDFALSEVEFGSIAGTVLDTDGEPVANAFVSAHRMGGFGGGFDRSDEDGNYLLENIYPGSYRMRAFAHGYFPQTLEDEVVVGNGEDVTGVDFALEPFNPPFDGMISGTVTDEETTEPIEGALVVAIGRGNGHPWIVRRFAHTDENGAYNFDHLPPFEYKVFCMADDYVSEFYDNQQSWQDADPVTPDAENIDFALAPAGEGIRMISGQVIEDGAPAEAAVVMAKLNDEVVGIGVTFSDGYYYIENLEPNDYALEVVSPTLAEGNLDDISVVYADYYDADFVLSPTSVGDGTNLPAVTTLGQNYPNPFNATTNINFSLSASGNAELAVYDLLGRQVTTLVSGNLSAGPHTFTWNGQDDSGKQVASGLYLYVLKTADGTQSKRMVLLK